MADLPEPRIKLPDLVRVDEAFEVKTIIEHPMEHGRRRDAAGALVPRRIINRFACSFEGIEVCSMELGTGVASNPLATFWLRLPGPGELRFSWFDDDGSVYSTSRRIEPVG